MINTKKLHKLARKWQRTASAKCRRISYPKSGANLDPLVADKGHFVVYTTDEKRFMVLLEYLSQNVFIELWRMSEEEFGLPTHRAITLPCDSSLLEYVISLVQGRMPAD
ncbi:auxin-responsive protein SAUR64-like [Pistacia vera]|uniref:auxin-responsive protein SAUR64-like n=1 Tax=Pistacia vera TaxID=55513 RepID=UPI001262EE7B|nr:auxin-responsive protein SAUR64-like [Pistacia vera]KAJ0077643.1 hypothetical protein Patl1_35769 [Pistacia atlantica]